MSLPGMILRGLLTYLPGWQDRFSIGTGGSVSARYCYAVWMRHLVLAKRNGFIESVPGVIAELGPGSSLGIGLAGLLSGSECYYALDVVRHASNQRNQAVFAELVELFRQREPIPSGKEFPKMHPLLEDTSFPDDILTDEILKRSLSKQRLLLIKSSLESIGSPSKSMITYMVPWDRADVINECSVDMVYSQAVLEHVDDLPGTYHALHRWLKPGGLMSHQIDFGSHQITSAWNGHWAISENLWKLIRGRRPYLINRLPASVHFQLISQSGFITLYNHPRKQDSGIRRSQLSSRFKHLSEEDFTTSGTFIQAKKNMNIRYPVPPAPSLF